jgi:hypothetical protein
MVGIDEAGYGPNLGPLVMTAVSCSLPGNPADTDLWHVLRGGVRRRADRTDRRILVEDSKVVYSTSRGLHDLERGVLAALGVEPGGDDLTLARLLDRLCPDHHHALKQERWYAGQSRLPVEAQLEELAAARKLFRRASDKARVAWADPCSVVTCPARFNLLLDHWGTKGAVLGQSLVELIRGIEGRLPAGESVLFLVDKHGGRNSYAPLLQEAFPGGFVMARCEGMERSQYGVIGLERVVEIVVMPRADLRHFCVALASMISKFVRELLMLEFNAFWRSHLPALKPTAGYPLDAARFFADIRPVVRRLGIAEAAIWRRQ